MDAEGIGRRGGASSHARQDVGVLWNWGRLWGGGGDGGICFINGDELTKEQQMGQCNRCTLRNIKKVAKKDGKTVLVNPDSTYALGGMNVYVKQKHEALNHDQHFVAWMMEIGKMCEC